jgi:hypothetical protein
MPLITINPTLDMETGALVAHDGQYFVEDVPLKFDRAAQAQASNAAQTAGDVGDTEFQQSQAEKGLVVPRLTEWMNAEHLYGPDALNQLLTAAGAGTGGATGALTAEAALQGARTRNTGMLSPEYDALARGKQQSMASASEKIASQDVTGAVARQQDSAKQLGGMADASTEAALKAMGIQTQDINAEIEAGKSGWFQNMTGLISALGKGAQGAGSVLQGLNS